MLVPKECGEDIKEVCEYEDALWRAAPVKWRHQQLSDVWMFEADFSAEMGDVRAYRAAMDRSARHARLAERRARRAVKSRTRAVHRVLPAARARGRARSAGGARSKSGSGSSGSSGGGESDPPDPPHHSDKSAPSQSGLPNSNSLTTDALLTTSELAAYLRLCAGTVRSALSHAGRGVGTVIPPPIYIGRLPRWRAADVARWLSSRSRASVGDEK